MKPKFTPRESKAFTHTHYDPESKQFTVVFNGGHSWVYDGVPPELHDEFEASDSFGKFFANRIKGAFPATKVEQP